MRGEGAVADVIKKLFNIARKKAGIPKDGPKLSTSAFRRLGGRQQELFD
jgi:hypothetical protein